MVKKSGKMLSVLLALIVLLSCFSAGITAFGSISYPVAINETNFPDAVWRSIVSSNYDTDADGYLSETEALAVTRISPLSALKEDDETIADLTGIEYFTALTTLRAADVGLESIDISALTALTTLDVQGNSLTALDVSASSSLKDLNCRGNTELTTLELCPTLTKLQCDGCAITALDVSTCTSLTTLSCYDNELTELDLSNNTVLTSLNCSINHITSLDLSSCTLLEGNITSSHIGSQSASATAYHDSEIGIYIPLELDDYTKLTSSNIENPNESEEDGEEEEEEETVYTGYDSTLGAFVVTDYELLSQGIEYTYNVSLTASDADMDVSLTITKDFYRVRYYTSADAEEPISTQYVNYGEDAAAPELSDTATCITWTPDSTNITEDTDIYLYQNSAHSLSVSDFDSESGTVTFTCGICAFSEDVRFIDYVNNDSPAVSEYYELLDINSDGTVDVSDYSELIDLFGE
ncbi:MAG: hypothetical protein LUH82_07290 [Clostridiales bacterium]|nr:hypothetical protein [Clostridiales bacterium]